MIIIQPIGGLCNRMRAINSARVLAKKRGETLKVIWNVNPELGCPFEELFQKTDAFSLRNIHSKWDPQKVFYQLTRTTVGNEELRTNRTEQGLPDAYVASLPKNLYIATEEPPAFKAIMSVSISAGLITSPRSARAARRHLLMPCRRSCP